MGETWCRQQQGTSGQGWKERGMSSWQEPNESSVAWTEVTSEVVLCVQGGLSWQCPLGDAALWHNIGEPPAFPL